MTWLSSSPMRFLRWTGIGASMVFTVAVAPYAYAADVADCSDLQDVADDLDGTYVQTADIDCTGVDFLPIGTIGTPFSGSYDGNGFVIENLVINQSALQSAGIFGATDSSVVIEEVGYVSGSVTGNRFVGGIVGYNQGTIRESFSQADIIATNSGPSLADAGGLVGVNSSGTINDCYATGDIDSYAEGGGLAGYASGTISRSFATGNVSATENAGGLVGRAESLTVQYSFATGIASDASSKGGLLGVRAGGVTVTADYWLQQDGSPSHCYNGGDTGCTAVTDISTLYRKANAPLSSWDFDDVWSEQTGSLPLLAWQADTVAPSAPTNFAATANGADIVLSWDAPGYGDFQSVTIRRSSTDYPSTINSGTLITSGLTAETYSDRSRPNDVYYYSLFGRDVAGNAAVAVLYARIVLDVHYDEPSRSGGSRGSNTDLIIEVMNKRNEPRPAVHPAAPARTTEQTPEVMHVRTCDRVMKWFRNNAKMLERVNARLEKRFRFVCTE